MPPYLLPGREGAGRVGSSDTGPQSLGNSAAFPASATSVLLWVSPKQGLRRVRGSGPPVWEVISAAGAREGECAEKARKPAADPSDLGSTVRGWDPVQREPFRRIYRDVPTLSL